jgi:2-oxoglutarate ferredoxin oxidoreductase subunit alpha
MDYSIKIGGEAGQGIQTIGNTLAQVFARAGYHVYTHQDYESRIRGGHNFYQIRFSEGPVSASREKVDVLIALDINSIPLHEKELSENGLILYDAKSLKQRHEQEYFLDVPAVDLAIEHGGNKIMANTVAVGAVLGIVGMNIDILTGILRDTFKKKGEDVIAANVKTARAGYDFALHECKRCSFSAGGQKEPNMLISGIESIALGAIASGCKFYAAYPMTPSTGIMNYLAGKEKEYGIVVEQAEDEIAAINMALGASFAGVRAMTGTSGGGFALMVEGLSLAGITETPIVIALGQRPGPATGLPTRTEQGELLFSLYAGHGEFPRVIFAPGTPEQAFFLTQKAFHLSEKYQIPVLVLFDQYLADTQWTFNGFDLNRFSFTDYRLRGDVLKNQSGYKRHAFTDTGISPLGIPGESAHLIVTDSDEHSEEGHIVEDAETRIRMVEKRLFKKMPLIKQEIGAPVLYGNDSPEIVMVGWGSTYGVLKEAVDVLSKDRNIAMVHFSEIYPFPSIKDTPSPTPLPQGEWRRERASQDYLSLLHNAKQTICIEHNATGQFARLLKAESGYSCTAFINRYDGRPFLLEELLGEIHALIE